MSYTHSINCKRRSPIKYLISPSLSTFQIFKKLNPCVTLAMNALSQALIIRYSYNPFTTTQIQW